ncbi:MAG TPA: hypothetical protein VFE37_08770 [Chloroflexota bacterium]|nr:hypothetical protein [Chloroflexota bacterium]
MPRWTRRGHLPVAFLLVVALWALGALAVGAGTLADLRGRAAGPEAPLRTYLAAVTAEDAEAALAEVLPAARPAAIPFVVEQLGNQYEVLGLGVRQPSLLDRLRGQGPPADEALITVQLDIVLTTGETWRTTTHVPLVRTEDGWYLVRPPLQPVGG